LIADFLFEHDVNYKYERNHYWSNVNYRPDFTLFSSEKSGLIIEYFGLSGDTDYDEMSKQKEVYWKRKPNWELLNYTPIDITKNGPDYFKDKLKSDIESRGFTCKKLSDEEIWLRCKERAIDRFTGAMVSFIGRCRKLSLSYEDLLARCQNYSAEADVERQFLNFACKFYCDYLGALTETGNDDFDGLIQKAVTTLKQGNTLFESTSQSGNLSNIKYISIDEYQDFSLLFNNLIQSVIVNTESANLFCVGDDWQAINGFSGSDLIYFNQISDYIDSPRILHMPTNYRSPDGIVSIGNTLMTGLGKPAESHHKDLSDIKLVDLDSFQPTRIEAARHSGDNITPVVLRLVNESLNRNQDVVLLCRKNSINGYVYYEASQANLGGSRGIERYLQFIRSFFQKNIRERITISTAHKYKGLEKPTVIVMDLVKRSYPLVHPDWVFTRVFGDNLQSITEEEKRLLYVALTRPEKDLYIITDKKEPSPFLAKLETNSNIEPIDWQKFSPFVAEGQVRQVTLKVSNNGFGYNESKGTVPIKDILIASGYRYQSSTFSWEKVFLREGFSRETIKNEAWFKQAEAVKLEIYDDTEQLVGDFVI
jgi:DNA helicase-4